MGGGIFDLLPDSPTKALRFKSITTNSVTNATLLYSARVRLNFSNGTAFSSGETTPEGLFRFDLPFIDSDLVSIRLTTIVNNGGDVTYTSINSVLVELY